MNQLKPLDGPVRLVDSDPAWPREFERHAAAIGGALGGCALRIEHVGSTAIGARLQKAWLKIDVMQCGYCQAGQIMAASAFLAQTPHPTPGQIESAMAGNICRCGCYHRIRTAIGMAAGADQESSHVT